MKEMTQGEESFLFRDRTLLPVRPQWAPRIRRILFSEVRFHSVAVAALNLPYAVPPCIALDS